MQIDTPYAQSWKQAFGNSKIFRDFIHWYFNKELARSIVPESMESINTELSHTGDPTHPVPALIYKTRCNFKDSARKPFNVYFIIEFQSVDDDNMPGKMLSYANHLYERLPRLKDDKNDYRIITIVINAQSGMHMMDQDPRTIDFQSYFDSGIPISPYYQVNIENFSDEELISAGGVISAMMYMERMSWQPK